MPTGEAVVEVAPAPPEAVTPCTTARTRTFERDGVGIGGVTWVTGCADTAEAIAALQASWEHNVLFPFPAEPALGAAHELVSPFPGMAGIQRLWVEGSAFAWVFRWCDLTVADASDPEGCIAESAADVLELSAALPGEPAVIPGVQHPADDHFAGWTPTGDNGWQLASARPFPSLDTQVCPTGAIATWTGFDGTRVTASWIGCEDRKSAQSLSNEAWTGLSQADHPLVFGSGIDRVGTQQLEPPRVRVFRSWVQGSVYVNVERDCAHGDEELCARESAADALSLETMLPGDPVVDTNPMDASWEFVLWFAIVPIVTVLLVTVPRGIVAWLRTRGYSVTTDNPRFTSVDRYVRRVRILRIVRRVIVGVLTVVIWIVGLITIAWGDSPWVIAWTFLGPFAILVVVNFVVRLIWPPQPLVRLARRHRKLRALDVVAQAVRALAMFIAFFALFSYLFGSFLLLSDRWSKTPATIDTTIANEIAAGGLLLVWGLLRQVVHALDDAGIYWVAFFIQLAVPVFAAYLIDRVGQRISARSLEAALAEDDRPYFLYLRGFDEDRLRIDESVGRRGFIELLTPFGRPRFEELLAEYLSQYGPVIAIASGRQGLSDLGAAKITLAGGEWQQRVRDWAGGARAVVMSATPREVRAGLKWEMQHLAESGSAKRLMLVVAPWPRAEVARRWSGFLERARQWPLFAPLAEDPMPSGVAVMTWSAQRGWRGYGAKRRWDWTYAASILTAYENGDLGADVIGAPGTAPDAAHDQPARTTPARETVEP